MLVAASRTGSTANFNPQQDGNGAAYVPPPATVRARQTTPKTANARYAGAKQRSRSRKTMKTVAAALTQRRTRHYPDKSCKTIPDNAQAADQQRCIEPQAEADTFAPTTADIGYVGQLIEST